MTESVRVQAAAKVNLHLRVYNRRADGFHDILSLFQAVSLADSIVIRSLKESNTLKIDGDFDCPLRSTTIYKAAEAYRDATGIKTGLSISVDKRIPTGAGLGGGSSDAASVLTGLEALLCGGLGTAEIAGLGASIGSDVPFFLSGSAAIVSGRGEIVCPIEARNDFSIVIVFPGFPVFSATAYAALDRERPDDSAESDPSSEELLAAYQNDIRAWPFVNSFEAVIGRTRPEIPAAKGIIRGAGASFSAMSGSGSSVFGVFEGGAEAEAALGRIRALGLSAYYVTPLAHHMVLG
jgi:4-diphosphocytidyl-2-C-methyl-D-erythritol kinase